MNFTPFDPELGKLIANLPQASSLDLYRIEVAVRKLRDEPNRIIGIRSRLHLGMTVHFMNAHDATMHTGRIVALRDRDVTIDDSKQKNSRWSGVPYAAIDLQATAGPAVEIIDAPKSAPAPRRPTRADFKVGDAVSFIDRDQQTRIGKIVRLNQKTASIECDNGLWRVSFGWLQHLVDV